MATIKKINSACTEVVSACECHVLYIYSNMVDGVWLYTVEDQYEGVLLGGLVTEQEALDYAVAYIEKMEANDSNPDCDDSDDGQALASAGWGVDEDYVCDNDYFDDY